MTGKRPSERRRQKMWDMGARLEEIRELQPERKTERLQLRVTPTEKEEVEWITDLLGVSAADYLMHLHRRAIDEFDRKLERDSRRGGGSPPRRRSARPTGPNPRVPKRRRREGRRRRDDDEGVLV